jgi:hypothetical protein
MVEAVTHEGAPGNPSTAIASVINPNTPQYTKRDRSGALRCWAKAKKRFDSKPDERLDAGEAAA